MSLKKYSEIFGTDEVLAAGNNDIILLAIEDIASPTGFTTKAIKKSNLIGVGANIYSVDGALAGNRILDGTGIYSLSFIDLNVFTLSVNDSIFMTDAVGNTLFSMDAGAQDAAFKTTLGVAKAATEVQSFIFSDLGATPFQGALQNADLTAARTWTLPDKTGTIAMLSDVVPDGNGIYSGAGSTPAGTTVVTLGGSLSFRDGSSNEYFAVKPTGAVVINDVTTTTRWNLGVALAGNTRFRIRGIATDTYINRVEDSAGNIIFETQEAGNTIAKKLGVNIPNGTVPSDEVEVNGNIKATGYKAGASTGLSGTFSFGGGATGDIASMTFTGGILTGTTLVP